MAADDSTISVTVIGGYLGAGKTTLLNHILSTATERIAVLVNDFGDINIDEALIESNDGDTLSLANGCICCSIVDGFAAALDSILELSPRPSRLVIEASGVADPATVAAWGHGPGFELDATVVVADAEQIRTKSTDKYVGDTVLAQLRAADIVILNKADLCDPDDLEVTRAWLGERCPGAAVVTATDSVVDRAVLFDTGLGHVPEPSHIHADEIFTTWSWTPTEPVSHDELTSRMDGLADEVVRAKGIVWLAEDPDRRTIVQRVGKRWTIRPGEPWAGDPHTTVVFIAVGDGAEPPVE